MRIFTRIKNYISNPDYRFAINSKLGLYRNMPDDEFLKKKFKIAMGKELDLENPRTFCEKLQWMKAYDHNPRYTMLADKYEVKKIIAEEIGEQYVIPLYGVWDSFDEIDFDSLPEQFILKCTHNSGGFVICKDKSNFDKASARKKFNKWLKRNYYDVGREWVYKNIKPRIIAEKYIPTLGNRDSIEYKLTCFDGEVKLITICQGIPHDSLDSRTNDHYDRDFNRLDWYAYYKNPVVPNEIPEQMPEMIEIAEKLSKGICQVRVDFYIIDGQIYFGEMTFYTWGGYIEFVPPERDEIMGSYIKLPEKRI